MVWIGDYNVVPGSIPEISCDR